MWGTHFLLIPKTQKVFQTPTKNHMTVTISEWPVQVLVIEYISYFEGIGINGSFNQYNNSIITITR